MVALWRAQPIRSEILLSLKRRQFSIAEAHGLGAALCVLMIDEQFYATLGRPLTGARVAQICPTISERES